MPKDIKIRRGYNLKLKGEAEKRVEDAKRSQIFALKPTDFHGVTPKLVVKQGQKILAGDTLFYSKDNPEIKFSSPVSGTVAEINRGPKRVVLDIKVAADTKDSFKDFGVKEVAKMNRDTIISHLLQTGCWPFIKQRPYDVIANPADCPKAIFISAYNSAPMSADIAFILEGREKDFQAGIDVLSKLTDGKVHLSIPKNSDSFFTSVKGVELHRVSGPHPAGNVGVQIHHIDPISFGEKVWVVSAEDVALIGNVFMAGHFSPTRTIAVGGSVVQNPRYFKTKIGSNFTEILKAIHLNSSVPVRYISGDVLTGKAIAPNGFIGYYDQTISIIPEGKNYRMFGWLPFKDNSIPSTSKTSFSWLFGNKEFEVTTNMNGEERALVVTGEMERVFPMDIYPMQLLKACMAQNIEKMENLGIYEVSPEDFGLVDFVCTSKLDTQEIIREGIDLMIREVG